MIARPSCPQCFSQGKDDGGRWKVVVHGRNRWRCSECGHVWSEIKPQIDNSDLERYIYEPRLYGDFLIIFDPHFPLQHMGAFFHAKEMCEKWGIKKCVIPGDTLDLDAFKKFLDKHPDIDGWTEEKTRTQCGLEWLATWMDEIHLVLGNHELRFWKNSQGKADQDDIFAIIIGGLENQRKFRYYVYPFAVINDSWIVDHPNMTSQIPGRVPHRLSDKYMPQLLIDLIDKGKKGKNNQYGYISGHGHLGGEATNTSGLIQIANGMVMCDPDLFGYYKLKRSARPAWRIGFNILMNNYLYRFPELNTDWNWWLK